jgi:hypothetical protein
MGNYVLRNALQALMRLPDPTSVVTGDFRSMIAMSADAPDPSVLRRSFDKIILAAADEDSDTFDDPLKLKYLPRIAEVATGPQAKREWIPASGAEMLEACAAASCRVGSRCWVRGDIV